ncbi:MAG TPA: ROK family protein [Kofleriaceae bacterium]|nr:ROK family protein [Kofleriaceae bacterium]
MTAAAPAWVVGVDLGGTNLRVAAFGELGALSARARHERTTLVPEPSAVARRRVGDDRRPEAIVEAIATMVEEVLAKAGVSPVVRVPVGIGIAAMLRDREGLVANSPHLRWRDVPFGDLLAARLGPARPLGIYNDVNAIAYGEFGLGAAAGADDVLTVYIGTGIGGGLIVNGQLADGITNAAGEIGHTKVLWGDDAAPCACGGRGCVEAYVGGTYVQSRARAELARGDVRSLAVDLAGGDPHEVTPGHVDQAAAAGDPWALELWTELAPLLAVAIGNAITLLNPERVVLGGGMLGRTPLLKDQTLTALPMVVPAALLDPVTIVDAVLGDDAGLIGAALLASDGAAMKGTGS